MADGIAIIMPAHRAAATIADAVKSVLNQAGQSDLALEIVIAADDGEDYRAVLARDGVADRRLVHTATATPGSGASAARNAALGATGMRYAATLDADDLFAPGKIARILAPLHAHGLVSTGLSIVSHALAPLRTLGVGPDRMLAAAAYKFTNFSMDSMIAWDRNRADPRYDPSLPCMTDLDFLMRLFAHHEGCFHIGAPLHVYRKLAASISNGDGVAARMIATKQKLRERIAAGAYPFADPAAGAGLDGFLTLSLQAEASFSPDPALPGPPLFEDHIEPLLAGRPIRN